MIKVISLDLWGTLAQPNKDFNRALSSYFSSLFDIPQEDALARYKTMAQRFDHAALHFGTSVQPLIAVKRLVEGMKLTRTITCVKIFDDLIAMVARHPPRLHGKAIDAIEEVRKTGMTVGISSNTNFIPTSAIVDILKIPVDFHVSSGQLGISKPDPDFFEMILKRGRAVAGKNLLPSSFIHIGNHPLYDVRGAMNVGIQGCLVANATEAIDILKKLANDLVVYTNQVEFA